MECTIPLITGFFLRDQRTDTFTVRENMQPYKQQTGTIFGCSKRAITIKNLLKYMNCVSGGCAEVDREERKGST